MIVGPGGVGKGTVVSRLVADDPLLWLSRSWTTREQRPAEPDSAYVFVTREEFAAHERAGGFLEHAEFLGNLYGTPLPTPPSMHDVVLEIDMQGAQQVLARCPGSCVVYLVPPSAQEQERRLRGRGDPDDRVRERIAVAADEDRIGRAIATHVVVNHDVDQAVADLQAIVTQFRADRLH